MGFALLAGLAHLFGFQKIVFSVWDLAALLPLYTEMPNHTRHEPRFGNNFQKKNFFL
ncbi:hypothetical protein Pan258_57570 [Symmachiella dynata]|uniref:Uncharacterized protein n=1 Tax=Symmachiella dynata TaxID=2527995 RepID=A0A517ZY21_9PLAN|nr:hypothetical protein Pan258_57570 [Symmachiella dynata]QDU47367.1 hypothetical protein Mal52_58960 [Symmachiella dynata]|tara:strand:+ start:602 stop:772 length:171 start_codon:yes stop_codon:yes gene_type:complete